MFTQMLRCLVILLVAQSCVVGTAGLQDPPADAELNYELVDDCFTLRMICLFAARRLKVGRCSDDCFVVRGWSLRRFALLMRCGDVESNPGPEAASASVGEQIFQSVSGFFRQAPAAGSQQLQLIHNNRLQLREAD